MSHLEQVSGGSMPERMFGNRFPDLVFKNRNTSKLIAVQVGRTTKSGLLPVIRERRAIGDLQNTGKFEHVFFIKY